MKKIALSLNNVPFLLSVSISKLNKLKNSKGNLCFI